MNPNALRVWSHLGFVLVLFCLLPSRVVQAQPKLPRLLILYEVGTTYPGINLIDQGIRDVLDTSPDKLEAYREYMDTILFDFGYGKVGGKLSSIREQGRIAGTDRASEVSSGAA